MKILLTGANGFIGSYFLDKYRLEYQIKTFSFLKNNFDSLDLSGLNTIVHLSALVHQMGGANSNEYEKVNVIQTLELAKKAKDSGVRHFIFMSTVKVYGDESDTAYTEKTPCHPQDDYGQSKWHAELELQKLSDEHFTVSIIRTPIVYGTGVKANIKNLIKLISKVPILPFANTKNRRSMVYVGNLCALIAQVLARREAGIFLACDDTSLSTTEFIREIATSLGKKCYLIDIPFFENLLKYFKPTFHQRLFGNLIVDNTETKKKLGFRNPYSTAEGIKAMITGNNL
ncbi:MAG: NAD-dependent epimerase/dehydratase family protein [Sulfuricurvum sp.]|nr:NAD-dependent epimerase/dehydratase family protein [Sulfuricurvum sp.]